jgi:hypothetical protein
MIVGEHRSVTDDIIDSLVKSEDIERIFFQTPESLLDEYNISEDNSESSEPCFKPSFNFANYIPFAVEEPAHHQPYSSLSLIRDS